VAFCLLANLAGILIAPGPVGAAVKVREIIPDEEAQKRVGQTVTVCGIVASTRYSESAKTKLTYLNLGRPYPDQSLTVVIPDQLRALYRFRPEEYFKGKKICAAGQITVYRDKPQIVIDDPSQIRLDQPVSPPANPTAESASP
jgi:DNA/RNA endonuclease YhcR with UshA esterase domain